MKRIKKDRFGRIFGITAIVLLAGFRGNSQQKYLRDFPETSDPVAVGKKITERFLSQPHSQYGKPPKSNVAVTQITYPDVCAWVGGLRFAEAIKDQDLFDSLQARFQPLFGAEARLLPKPNHVDNNVFGTLPLELYRQTKEQRYLDMGMRYADTQWELPSNANAAEKKWVDSGYSWQTRIWLDDMFMITAIQTQAFRATGDVKYLDRAAKEMVLYLDSIQLPNGLFYHSPSAHFSWGRGNGWMAVGMAELLRVLPETSAYRRRIMKAYLKMMASLKKYQAPDGMWRQVIDDPTMWEESSGTAMFTYAMIVGVRKGWLDGRRYGKAARKAWIALTTTCMNESGDVGKVCEGTNIGFSSDYYRKRQVITGDLHGQAPVLWCAYALTGPMIAVRHAPGQEPALSRQEKSLLVLPLEQLGKNYDPKEKMLTTELKGWNYHTDAVAGRLHDTRASLYYAVKLLDYGGKQNTKRALAIIDSVIVLQDTNILSRTCGVWPYYKEEPLGSKKAPVDYNWADFNAVSLIDIWIEHHDLLPTGLKQRMSKAILLAAKCIERRNVGPSYTNIAIMGTNVTYVAAQLFDQKDLLQYARNRLQRIYDYSVKRGGFDEYNSPTYTIVALDELNRMQRHIKEPAALAMIDSLYAMEWSMIARHYHKPTGQWVGPHSRAYSPLVDSSFAEILYRASGGRVGFPPKSFFGDVRIKHKIPAYLLHYFTDPVYPRTEKDTFITNDPPVIGTAWLTAKYALSSANRSSLWNQRHPLMVYWGDSKRPQYCQLRLLHDFYDFSSASFYSAQTENRILAGINFITNGGDKHISIDRLVNGRFKARDLRLRFEFDATTPISGLRLPAAPLAPFAFSAGGLSFSIQPWQLEFDGLKGRWETGRDAGKAWIDYVIYSGEPKDFDLSGIKTAVLGFTMTVDPSTPKAVQPVVVSKIGPDQLEVHWQDLQLKLTAKPTPQPPNL